MLQFSLDLKRTIQTLLFAGLLFSFSCTHLQGQNQVLQDSVDAVMNRYIQNAGGFSVAVIEPDGTITSGANGFASIGIPAADTLLFGMSDASQHMMAVLTLRMAEEGMLAIGDQLGNGVVPGSPAVFPPTVTIEELLGHTSGINSFTDNPSYFDPALSLIFNDLTFDYGTVNYGPILGAFVAPLGNASSTGSFQYSNTNYLILGEKLEMVGGKSLQALMDSLVLMPAGLSGIEFFVQQDLTQHSAFYFNLSGILPEALVDQRAVLTSTGASGSMISTPANLLQYLKALAEGQVLNSTSTTELLNFSPIMGRPSEAYGLGTERFSLTVDGQSETYIGHYGNVNYKTLMVYRPEDSLGVVVMNNLYDTSDSLVIALAEELLTKVKTQPMPINIEDDAFSPFDLQLFPNPANELARVHYSVPATAAVSIEMQDLMGRTIFVQELGTQVAGPQSFALPIQAISDGTYLVSVIIDGKRESEKLLIRSR